MSIEIIRTPSGDIIPGQSVTFSIISGASSCYFATFEWYLSGITGTTGYELVSTDSSYTTIFNDLGTYDLYLKITEYTQPSWFGGDFYGGTFRGAFSGGTFNYGNLNDCSYTTKIYTTKKFIEKT